jgi:predicted membrane protein
MKASRFAISFPVIPFANGVFTVAVLQLSPMQSCLVSSLLIFTITLLHDIIARIAYLKHQREHVFLASEKFILSTLTILNVIQLIFIQRRMWFEITYSPLLSIVVLMVYCIIFFPWFVKNISTRESLL